MSEEREMLELRYHSAITDYCKIVGLHIKKVPKCEGGGFMVRKDQAEKIVELLNGNYYEEARYKEELINALRPFANVAKYDIGESESDEDIFRPVISQYNKAKRITIGDIRNALNLMPEEGFNDKRRKFSNKNSENGWPNADKFGFPLNPEKDGWHFLKEKGKLFPAYWLAKFEKWVGSEISNPDWGSSPNEMVKFTYVMLCFEEGEGL